MCFHNSVAATPAQLVDRYRLKRADDFIELDFEPIYHLSAFVNPMWPVIKDNEPDKLDLVNWGLVPAWVKSSEQAEEVRKMTYNARIETAFEKPSFKSSIQHKRCLVPSTGFYEWHTQGKNKYPFFISVRDEEVFSMAGIWSEWNGRETFSILTTEANPLMARIHNTKKRMPVILPTEVEEAWLNPDLTEADIRALCRPLPEGMMAAYSISRLITSRYDDSNTPEVMQRQDYPELSDLFRSKPGQGMLF